MFHNTKILVIDDTAAIRTFLRISLELNGAQVLEAETGEEGEKIYKDILPDAVILDLGLPDKDGLEVLEELKALPQDMQRPVIILTVRKDHSVHEKVLSLGADAYLSKPFIMDDLIEIIQQNIVHQKHV